MERIVDLVYFDAGGGHRSAMEALAAQLHETYPGWTIRRINLQELLQPADPVYRVTRAVSPPLLKLLNPFAINPAALSLDSQTLYNYALTYGYTWGFHAILPAFKRLISFWSKDLEALLRDFWRSGEPPSLVVSLLPNFNGVLFRALKAVHPRTPYVTIMTDLMDTPPHFWMEDQDQTIICGTTQAAQQARASRFYAPHQVIQVSGMILKQGFYARQYQELPNRQSIGLDQHKPTALIMFGGNGCSMAYSIVKTLLAGGRLQAIVLCGRNNILREQLAGLPGCHAVAFTNRVAEYMRLADFFIGKPGPGAISEALHCGCPVLVERNGATMPQERPNTSWILNHGVGMVVRSLHLDLRRNVERLIPQLPAMRAAIRRNLPPNRAVFEIAELLPSLMDQRLMQHRGRRRAELHGQEIHGQLLTQAREYRR